MKKLLLSLFVVAAFSAASFAQLNLKAGLNLANQSFEASGISIDASSKVGFLLGVNYEAELSESIALRPGIQFTLKGSKFEFFGTSVSSNFSYIEVPVDFVYKSGSLSVHAGPYLGLLMAASSDGEDIKDVTKSIDFGLNFGAGYNFGLIGVGVNYGLGFSNITEDPEGSAKNKVLAFYVTYSI